MSIPNEKLQQLLQEIEQKAQTSQRDITLVKAQISGLQRESRKAEITAGEISGLPAGSNVWEGCGKMFVLKPPDELRDKLLAQEKQLKEDASNLGKKLHYLETTAKNSQQHIEQLLKSGATG